MTSFTCSDEFCANLERKQSHDVVAACCDVSAFTGSLEIALLILCRLLKDYIKKKLIKRELEYIELLTKKKFEILQFPSTSFQI